MQPRGWIVCGSLLAAIGVTLGAYHYHGLDKWLAARQLDAQTVAKRLDQCDVAARYQQYHALAIVLVGLLALRRPSTWLTAAGYSFLAGVLMFCGPLYLMVFTGRQLHVVIPLGGAAFIAGWCLTAVAGCHASAPPADDGPTSP